MIQQKKEGEEKDEVFFLKLKHRTEWEVCRYHMANIMAPVCACITNAKERRKKNKLELDGI